MSEIIRLKCKSISLFEGGTGRDTTVHFSGMGSTLKLQVAVNLLDHFEVGKEYDVEIKPSKPTNLPGSGSEQ